MTEVCDGILYRNSVTDVKQKPPRFMGWPEIEGGDEGRRINGSQGTVVLLIHYKIL